MSRFWNSWWPWIFTLGVIVIALTGLFVGIIGLAQEIARYIRYRRRGI